MTATALRNTHRRLAGLDAAHHLHPFTDHAELAKVGTRIITRAEGSHLFDSEGNRLLDAFAGLWCVNVGYGRQELAEAAYDQMLELPYYNTFFKTSTPPAVELSKVLSDLTPNNLQPRLLRLLRLGRQRHHRPHGPPILEPAGQAERRRRSSAATNGYHGSTMVGGQPRRHELHAPACRSAAAGLRPYPAALLVRRGR